MKLEHVAWALLGLASSSLTAAWWQPAFAWPAVALAMLGAGAVGAAAWLEARRVRITDEVVEGLKTQLSAVDDRVMLLAAKVETLQKTQALQSLR